MNNEHFERAIRDALLKRNAVSKSDREIVYSAARNAAIRRGDTSPEVIEDAISKVEASYTPTPSSPKPATAPWLSIGLPALCIGIVLGTASAVLMTKNTSNADEAEQLKPLLTRYAEQAPMVPIAEKYLQEIKNSIIRRQRENPESLKIAKKMIPLAQYDPALHKKIPKNLPNGTSILLRTDHRDFKILMNWPLCGTISLARPEMLDPRRSKIPSIGCPFFGIWTKGAENW